MGRGGKENEMIEVKMLSFEDLLEEERLGVSNNGCGKEFARYIQVKHNGKTIFLESDAMEPEDAVFYRDLSWIPNALKRCYDLGKIDGILSVREKQAYEPMQNDEWCGPFTEKKGKRQ